MNSIAEIFNYDKHLTDSIEAFFKKYIGCSLLSKCSITKIVDEVNEAEDFDYYDNPILRLIGDIKNSPMLDKVVSAKELLMDKIAMSICLFRKCFCPQGTPPKWLDRTSR